MGAFPDRRTFLGLKKVCEKQGFQSDGTPE